MMSIFYQEEPPKPSKTCTCLTSTIKCAFTSCHSFPRNLSMSSPKTEEHLSDFDEEEEIFVSAVISKYMESKSKRKCTFQIDSFSGALSPPPGDLTVTNDAVQKYSDQLQGGVDGEEFFSVGSRLSRCSSAKTFDDAFVSVKTRFSRCSSLNNIQFQDFRKQSIILEFSHCEGWPFGLCRKALLPPLPKSPSDSWSWRKGARTIKIHG